MKTIRVAGAIIKQDDKILACQRGHGSLKGGWEFPGGKLEPGESGAEACIREIQEELDVKIGDLRYVTTVEHDYDDFHISMECFLCSIESGEINDTEHEDMRWLTKDSLWSVNWLPADIDAVHALEKLL